MLTLLNYSQLNVKTRIFKEQYLAAWNSTVHSTTTGRPIDALICPAAPSVGIPHDFNIYWGYTSLFNLLDYPSVILPIPDFKINPQQDPIDPDYRPLETNPYDKPNYDLCKLVKFLSPSCKHSYLWTIIYRWSEFVLKPTICYPDCRTPLWGWRADSNILNLGQTSPISMSWMVC